MTHRRVLIWSQHLLGSGHFHRSKALALALRDRQVEVVLATGGPSLPVVEPRGLSLAQLAPVKVPDAEFSALVDEQGQPVTDALWSMRRERLSRILADGPLDALVTEMFPFGRRAFRAEVLWLVGRLREHSPEAPILCSVRDVLVSRDSIERYRWMAATCRDHYAQVLVHGDPAFLAFAESFPLADELGELLYHTGYIADVPILEEPRRREGVIISAGGGAVGKRLVETALAVAGQIGKRFGPWTIVSGSRAHPNDVARWRALAAPLVSLHAHVDDLPRRIGRARLSVSQAGYNTVAETLAVGTPMVLVPFETPSEDEQRRRADAVARAGHGVTIADSELSAASLIGVMERALALGSRPVGIAMGGAAVAADRIVSLIEAARD